MIARNQNLIKWLKKFEDQDLSLYYKINSKKCPVSFDTERRLKFHKEAVWCDECQLEWECRYHKFQDHASNKDHWLGKNLGPNWTAKISREAFKKPTVKMFNCAICGENFRTKSDLESHEETVWCNECQEEWKCSNHFARSDCSECKLKWNCDVKKETHMRQVHKLECDICQTNFNTKRSFKFHKEAVWCDECQLEWEYRYHGFRDHASSKDHWLTPNWTATKSTVKKNVQV